jgi:hypothetical protein
MTLRALVLLVGISITLAACSGGATSRVPSSASGGTQTQGATATGTLTFTVTQKSTSRRRKPAYVSPSTLDATLFIDGAASGFRVSCSPASGSSGTGTCTINWTSTAGSHAFVAEVDDGHTLLAEGAATYVVAAGSNATLAPLTLNGVAGSVAMITSSVSSSCSGSNPSCVSGLYALADADGNVIVTPGATYDNGPISVGSGAGSTASFTDGFTGNASGVGGLAGPDASGNDYRYTLACASGASGSFTLAFTPHATAPPSGELTTSELSTYSLTYPSSAIAVNWPTFDCSSGTISIAAAAPAAGTIYVLSNNSTIESFAPSSGSGATPLVSFSSTALSNNPPTGIAVDATGRVYTAITSGSGGLIYSFTYGSYSGGGAISPSTTLTSVAGPWSLAIDPGGDLVATDSVNNAVDFFAAGANGSAAPIKSIAGSNTQLNLPYQAAFDGNGNLYVINANTPSVTVYSASSISGTGTINATPTAVITSSPTGIDGPEGLAVDSSGRIYVGNSQNDTIAVFAAGSNGSTSPLATLNGNSTFTCICQATIATDASNNLYVAGWNANDVVIYAPVTSSSQSPARTVTSSSLSQTQSVSVVP